MIASSVASFLVLGGGGGGKTLNVPEKKIMYIILHEAQASEASGRLRNILFSGLKIHLYTYTTNAVPFYYFWYCAINDSIPTKH